MQVSGGSAFSQRRARCVRDATFGLSKEFAAQSCGVGRLAHRAPPPSRGWWIPHVSRLDQAVAGIFRWTVCL